MIKQVFYPYTEWEDYLSGMYEPVSLPLDKHSELVAACVELLSNEVEFYKQCLLVLDNWPKSSHHNLSNIGINRQAWLGQAACCYKYNASERITREVWALVKPLDQVKANKIADKAIYKYEEKNRALYRNLEDKRLFD